MNKKNAEDVDMVKNTLFNQKKMDELIDKYSNKLVINQPNKNPIEDWINRLNENTLVQEKQNYFNFRDIILNRILGYELEDIEFEHAHNDGRPVEFTLMKDNKEYVILEAKGTNTNLDKRYSHHQSAVEQATNYASVREDTKWAIVTNYDEIRLFNPSSREKSISFHFKELTNVKTLKEFLLTFSKFSLIDMDIPKKLMNEPQIMEKEFEDEFYKLFSETRLMIIKELRYSGIEKIEAIRYSQLILDRFIFICFAEDKHLLPSGTSTDTLLIPINNKNLLEFTLWDRLNELFRFIDLGNKIKDISKFNGGLFEENLRNLEIRDFIEEHDFYDDCKKNWKFKENNEEIEEKIINYKDKLNPIYKNLLIMSSFDFESEVDVNILGHIFENSIGDIEELKDQKKNKRKKDGVYYTPEYITDYICRNTIIPYLSKNSQINTIRELIDEYENDIETLDKKIRNIKILDPACGSGAFLNKAADILLEIHEEIFNINKTIDKTLDPWFDSITKRREILLDNIFGVDVNEESVEITRLAMFLKVAQKETPLPTLDENIKCGNSLIGDEKIAGEKAFDWVDEFPEIFPQAYKEKHPPETDENETFDENKETGENKGNDGFDVVIGNPPYVTPSLGKKQKTLSQEEIDYLNNHYSSYAYKGNTYVIFIERGLNILKNNGYLSYITPNTLLTNYYYQKIREILLNNANLKFLIEIKGRIFPDAETGGNLITIVEKSKIQSDLKCISFVEPNLLSNHLTFSEINKNLFKTFDDLKFLIDIPKLNLIIKLKNNELNLGNKEYFTIYQGIVTGNNKKFIIKEKNDENHLKLLKGADIFRYAKHWDNNYVIFDKKQLHSNTNEEIFLKSEKIISRQTSDKIIATYDNEQYFTLDSTHVTISHELNTKYLLGLYNSKLINFYYQTIVPEIDKAFPQVKTVNMYQIPIVIPTEEQEKNIIKYVNQLLNLSSDKINQHYLFLKWLNIEYNTGEITQRNNLFNFYELDEEVFITNLKKKIGKISPNSLKNILKEFNNFKENIKSLEKNIKVLNKELDNYIYYIYSLNQDEINIIES